ncbi:MAG: sodium/proton antiporter NhaB [Gammaproteobacteria bacterium]|nr:sodium/proton antiporter NhaB [Gammaproteobacteria bacterium]MBU1775211.1 sodium/proton antiporter NhaB [Gammaproteobacteria bacterium]MBU1968735.1 sodium/proton antiporter NhaB [Gammaproteobacteria bacterium]
MTTATQPGVLNVLASSFLGHTPRWYKQAIVACLILNVAVFYTVGPLITGWLILGEFIFTLAMALKCFPLQPGGLLALQAVILGLTDTHTVYREVEHGLPVLLLVIFMVAGVHFLRGMLYRMISHILLGIHSRLLLNLVVIVVVSVFSAFLDALTLLAVLVAVSIGFYEVYHKVVSSRGYHEDPDLTDDYVDEIHRADLEQFRAVLRSMLMHGAIGTAIGGVCTLVGEPENIVIGTEAGWTFMEFFMHAAPSTIPTLLAGFATCVVIEKYKWFGYGAELPPGVRQILLDEDRRLRDSHTARDRLMLIAQAVVGVLLVLALAFHVAEIGLIGLAVIVIVSSIAGVTDEHHVAEAFMPGLPFASLLVVFYVIVAMIGSQHMFNPIIQWVLAMEDRMQVFMIFITNGALSAISDNVFVAAIYMKELKAVFDAGLTSRELFDAQSVAVVMGTGIPSMSTPNGQAAFLYLLTSQIAPLIRLGYGRMLWMALPYAIVTTIVAGLTLY